MGKLFIAIAFDYASARVQENHEGLKVSGECCLIR
jgi:hypothetical protein